MTKIKETKINKIPTSKEVAALANVSQATVSRVFNGENNTTEKTKQKVLDAAKTLGYRPNAMARGLTLNRSNFIAIVTINVVNPHYNAVINKVASRIQEIGREPLYFVTDEEKKLDEILTQVLKYRVDGIIILSAAISSQMAAEFEKIQIPVVVFNKYTVNKNFMTVCSDNVKAGWMAANYLYEKGRRSFAFLGSNTFLGTSKDRLRGFKDCLEEKGITDTIVKMVPYSYESGKIGLKEIFEEGKPDAIFCAGDLLGLGVMDYAKNSLGLKIPEDLAVIGFDNIDAASWTPYNLTTFDQQIDKMLDTTFTYLDRKLHGENVEEGVTLFECEIIERESV